MPICTNCATELSYLYTVYDTAYNLRLELCPKCETFGDPYVEHDYLSLLLDLILLKREVYRHLVYNRGARPRYVTNNLVEKPQKSDEEERSRLPKERWKICLRIGALMALADSFVRWTQQRDGRGSENALEDFVSILLCCIVENVFFHIGVNCASALLLLLLRSSKPKILINASQISLSLVYSSIAKNLLLFMLAVWGVKDTPHASNAEPGAGISPFAYLDPENLPRQWIINNGLGGMTAGFGLRVILDCHPLLMTMIIFVGWATKAAAAGLVHSFLWRTDETLMRKYSLP